MELFATTTNIAVSRHYTKDAPQPRQQSPPQETTTDVPPPKTERNEVFSSAADRIVTRLAQIQEAQQERKVSANPDVREPVPRESDTATNSVAVIQSAANGVSPAASPDYIPPDGIRALTQSLLAVTGTNTPLEAMDYSLTAAKYLSKLMLSQGGISALSTVAFDTRRILAVLG